MGGGKGGSRQAVQQKSARDEFGEGTSRSSGGTRGVSQLAPWEVASDSLVNAVGSGKQIYEDARASRYFPGQLVVPFAQQSRAGHAANTMAAGAQAGVVGSAAGANAGIADGSNPYMRQLAPSNRYGDALYSMGAQRLLDQYRGEFANSGVAGSQQHQGRVARGLADYTSQFEHGRYRTDQSNAATAAGLQLQAANQAGSVADALTKPGDTLRRVGADIEGKRQAEIDAEVKRHQWEQDRGMNTYERFLGALGPLAAQFGRQSTAQDYRQNTDTEQIARALQRNDSVSRSRNWNFSW